VDRCIFCGELFGPGRKRSDEHAAPRWCAKFLPPIDPEEQQPEHCFVLETAEGRQEHYRGNRDPFTTVAEDVCEPCNTGWMEELEDWAERWLAKPLTGQRRALRYWRQVCAASWAIKTVMVWELVEPQFRTVPMEVLRIFHRLQRPGGRQQVWLGRYQGEQPHHSFRRMAAHVLPRYNPGGSNDPQNAHGYLLVVTIGELALVVFGHLLPMPPVGPDDPLPGIPLEDQFPSQLIQIWPFIHEVVDWPPPKVIDDAGLEAIVWALGVPWDQPPQSSQQTQ
jgi:hypothetical protein